MREKLDFCYQPLSGSNDIRLLSFCQDGDEPVELALNVTHHSLTEEECQEITPYCALSYVWGTEAADKSISLDGRRFPIRPNLELALRNLRLKDAKSHFWIDAISINQNDVAEKIVQVRMMDRIYSNADLTLIWLGESSYRRTAAARFLESNINFENGQCDIDLENPNTRGDFETMMNWITIGKDTMEHPWWRRMWTIQEVALGKKAHILMGQDMLQFQKLAIGVDFAFNHGLKFFPACEYGFINSWQVHYKMEYRIRRQLGKSITLQELLENSMCCVATDPRDLIFSLMAIATDVQDNANLVADYEQSVETVYTNTVKFHARKHGTLDVICSVSFPKAIKNLPSWVPDFTMRKQSSAHPFATFPMETPDDLCYFRASGNTLPEATALIPKIRYPLKRYLLIRFYMSASSVVHNLIQTYLEYLLLGFGVS